ncbi:MAG: hypothetical protein M4579_006959 [Chaenotheca gracillima]|nr:MAG: hypothetical protein M4579_006959 [Chaenotheca gracillima]
MATNPDTLIVVKVVIGETNRKFRVPLKELGANVFPGKLRSLLDIPESRGLRFERFSDSAGSFVTLDSNNPSVYKQLYRAAKAKLKLRIKAVLLEDPAVQPAPASSERSAPAPAGLPFLQPLSSKQFASGTAPRYYPYTPRDYSDWLSTPMAAWGGPLWASPPTSGPSGTAPPPYVPEPSQTAAQDQNKIPANIRQGVMPRPRHLEGISQLPGYAYSVYCNACEKTMPNAHYHCGICDDGDFDLCESCVKDGAVCHGEGHWLIKRIVIDGKVINSTTEKVIPSGKSHVKVETEEVKVKTEKIESDPKEMTRTCNSCIEEYNESHFVTCKTCEDYDLCFSCLLRKKHGHHPGHAFELTSEAAPFSFSVDHLCEPGQNVRHHAICDGCDKNIYGVRHKCLNCPDWDYCSTCFKSAEHIHQGHRFVPIYNQIASPADTRQRHFGIYCDGPLCSEKPSASITGDRYKCVVCHDTDFCANCEASPLNVHNGSHPLVKFKTPIRNVTVSTFGEHENGEEMPLMGDLMARFKSVATETATPASTNAATQVQTVAEMKPSEETAELKQEEIIKAATPIAEEEQLEAHFIEDTIADGTNLPPNLVFNQTWKLRNPGPAAWPANCNVTFVGGDGLQSPQPHEANEKEVAAGESHDFTVTFGTPMRHGRYISYWRLTAPDGTKFGHKLWCDVTVTDTEAKAAEKSKDEVETEQLVEAPVPGSESEMIFPKLEKESPFSSMHEAEVKSEVASTKGETTPNSPKEEHLNQHLDDLTSEVTSLSLDDDETEDGFLTDEEYDVLDASDEEFLAEAQNAANAAGKK